MEPDKGAQSIENDENFLGKPRASPENSDFIEEDQTTCLKEESGQLVEDGNNGGLSKTALKKMRKMEKWKETKNKRKEEEKRKKKEKKMAKQSSQIPALNPTCQSGNEETKESLEAKEDSLTKGENALSLAKEVNRGNSTEEPMAPIDSLGPKDKLPKDKKTFKRILRKELQSRCAGQPFIAIHCVWSNLMTEKENTSMVRQLNRCYSLLYDFERPFNLCFTDCAGKLKEKLLKNGAENWTLELTEKSLLDRFPVDSLVYLSGDAKEVMEKFDPTSTPFKLRD